MVACNILSTFRFPLGIRAWLLVSVLAGFWCSCIFSQTVPENRLPDPISEHTPPDISWETRGLVPSQPRHSIAVPEQQLITANALKAPDKARKALQRAAKAIHENRMDEAVRQIAQALEIYPDYAQALTLRALIHIETARMEAVKDLEQAIQLDPSSALPYAILGSTYNDAKSYDDAFPLISRALQLLPTAWQVHFEMARTLSGRHQTTEALREIGNALRLSSDLTSTHETRAVLHFWRGKILVDQNDLSSAKFEFQQAMSEQPNGIFAQGCNRIITRLDAAAIR